MHLHGFAPPPRLLICGAIDFAASLARLAGAAGYRVTIADPREPFASSPRFAAVAEVVREWPDRAIAAGPLGAHDAVVVLTHDPNFDEPALLAAVHSGAGYVGALGSRRTQRDRRRRLREAGAGEQELARVAGPCGLDIGARTPEQTAVSILAEMIAVRHGRDGGRLIAAAGAIHARGDRDA